MPSAGFCRNGLLLRIAHHGNDVVASLFSMTPKIIFNEKYQPDFFKYRHEAFISEAKLPKSPMIIICHITMIKYTPDTEYHM